MFVLAIFHFVYLLLTLVLFIYSLITSKLKWISKRLSNYFLLHVPALLMGIVLSFNHDTLEGKIMIITSPVYTLLIGVLLLISQLERKIKNNTKE